MARSGRASKAFIAILVWQPRQNLLLIERILINEPHLQLNRSIALALHIRRRVA